MMNQQATKVFTSSTPFQPRQRRFVTDLFGNEISPITEELEQPKKHDPQVSKSTKPSLGVPNVQAVTRKRKKVVREIIKEKESASNAVLRELGEVVPTNALSVSRNMYNMFPEMIVIDSDDEEVKLTPNSKKKPSKSEKTVNNATKPPEKENQTSKRKLEEKAPAKPVRSTRETKKKETTRVLPKVSPMNELLISDEVIDVEALLSLSKSKKKFTKQNSIIDVDTQTIAWNPRTTQGVNQAPDTETAGQAEVLGNDEPTKESVVSKTRKPRGKDVTSQTKTAVSGEVSKTNKPMSENVVSQNDSAEKQDIVRKKSRCKPKSDQQGVRTRRKDSTSSRTEESTKPDNSFPTDCLARFKDAVFRPNKHSGGIVANCFHTDTDNFGYVEVEEGKVFIGHRSEVTFVLLEGRAVAAMLGSTETLMPGDILHIRTGITEYKFKNHGPGHARLLYVKKKASE